MEKENPRNHAPASEFFNHLALARQNDAEAILSLLEFFKQDIAVLTQRMPTNRQDAMQSMTLELINLLKKTS